MVCRAAGVLSHQPRSTTPDVSPPSRSVPPGGQSPCQAARDRAGTNARARGTWRPVRSRSSSYCSWSRGQPALPPAAALTLVLTANRRGEPSTPMAGMEQMGERPLEQLAQTASQQAVVLAREQVEVARRELTARAKQAGPGVAMMGGGALLAALASGTGTAALILLLARRPGASAAALGVTGAYAGAGALLAREGLVRLREAGPPQPDVPVQDEPVQSAEQNLGSAKRRAKSTAKSPGRAKAAAKSTGRGEVGRAGDWTLETSVKVTETEISPPRLPYEDGRPASLLIFSPARRPAAPDQLLRHVLPTACGCSEVGSAVGAHSRSARFSGAHGEAHRRTVFLACPRFFLVLPRARAAFPLALCDLRPVTFPTSSSTRPARRSTAPSVLLRRALLNTVLPRFSSPTRQLWAGSAILGAMAAIVPLPAPVANHARVPARGRAETGTSI